VRQLPCPRRTLTKERGMRCPIAQRSRWAKTWLTSR